MRDKNPDTGDSLERDIAARFARMRELEASTAPAFSSGTAARFGRPAAGYRWLSQYALPGMAAALALVAIAVTLLNQRSGADDPAALYAGLMNRHHMQTDPLLSVSSTELPALSDLPQLYQVEFEYVPAVPDKQPTGPEETL